MPPAQRPGTAAFAASQQTAPATPRVTGAVAVRYWATTWSMKPCPAGEPNPVVMSYPVVVAKPATASGVTGAPGVMSQIRLDARVADGCGPYVCETMSRNAADLSKPGE